MEKMKTYSGRIVMYAVLLMIAAGVMAAMKRCSITSHPSQGGERASSGDTIDVAIEYAPLSIYTYNDTLGGFNYDLLRLIAARHGVAMKFHPIVTLTKALDGMDKGLYDIVVASVPMTADGSTQYRLSEPVYLDRQVLVQLRDSTGECRVKSQLDLAGDTVWVVEKSPIAHRVENLAREIGDTIYTRFEPLYGAEQLFMMTATGEIRQAVINERIARELAADYPNVDISTDISFTQFQSWILDRNNAAMGDSIDSWIRQAKETDAYKDLERRYLK
ncbi:MAG: transporter substrate-binding domain-containing protein [Pseudoflavonifractor sp.]|nr:transporter substrate-binding domain-containing protein [Pseudoflavonifractor sp.]